jgi:hypothetical protein
MAMAGEEWKQVFPDSELRELFMPIATVMEMYSEPTKRAWFENTDLCHKLAQACPMAAVEIAGYWRRRFSGKVVPIRRP